MGKKLVDLSYMVRGDFSPNGLQKVFFSFHPSDKKQMEQIADDVLSFASCAVYYCPDTFSQEDIDLEDYALKLQEMKLFVVIVTTNYLTKDSFSKDWEFDFAVKHNIPILPVAVESGLEELFSIEMGKIGKGYGDIQLLKSRDTDKTEIPYRQKLYRDLGAILVDDDELEKVKKAFRSRIFLSYRKKDRKYANELMRAIHSIPSLQTVSIWYDEFIASGEKWDDQIEEALRSSDMFLLLASPWITEPDNYVIRVEYPAARNQNMQIISARKGGIRSKKPTHTELQRIFPGLRIIIDGDNTAELEEALQALADNQECNPEQDYLIGLAFFTGIGMERDLEKAVSLIVAAAQNNWPRAINRLAEMYWRGDGIAVHYENSILWRKRLVEIYEHQLTDPQYPENALNYVEALEKLTVCLYELNAFRDSLVHGQRIIAFGEQSVYFSNSAEFAHYLSKAYDMCGKNCRRLGLYDDAIAYTKKYLELTKTVYESAPSVLNLHNLSVCYARMGDTYNAVGNFTQSEEWYLQALEIDEQINRELQSVDSADSLSATYLALGDIYIANSGFQKAAQYYSQAVTLQERILDAKDSDEHYRKYGGALLSLGTALLLNGEVEDAKSRFLKAKEIMANLAEKSGTIESQHACSVALNRYGSVCEQEGRFQEAITYYSDSLSRRQKILSRVRTAETVYEYAITLFFRAGAYQRLYNIENAKKDYAEVVEKLRTILPRDRKGNWHRIFAEAAFAWFKIDTFAGERYLQDAIVAWKWLVDGHPHNEEFRKQYELCRRIYQRCYPN